MSLTAGRERGCVGLVLSFLIAFASCHALANSYVKVEIQRTRCNETTSYHRVMVRFSELTALSRYAQLDSAILLPPSGGRLTMLNRCSSRSVSLSRYVLFGELREIQGTWGMELYAGKQLLDTLSFDIGQFRDEDFPPFAALPEGRIGDDPSIFMIRRQMGRHYLQLGGATQVGERKREGTTYRLPSDRITRVSISSYVEVYGPRDRPRYRDALSLHGHPPAVIRSTLSGKLADVYLGLDLLSESECWFAPGLEMGADFNSLAETLHAKETESHEPNSIDLFEDETGQPLLIYYTAGAQGSSFELEKSLDLKTWESVATVESVANVVPFVVNLDDQKAFFRVRSRKPTDLSPEP